MPRKAEVEDAEKKNRLTLAQLAAYDDVSTDVMIDQVSVSAGSIALLLYPTPIVLMRSRHTGLISEKQSARTEATSTSLCAYQMKQCQRPCYGSSLMARMWLELRSLCYGCLE
jgi:hypothetical protein